MGTLYHVDPLAEAGANFADWALVPEAPGLDASQPSRNPTLAEVRAVLDGFEKASVEYTMHAEGMDAAIADAGLSTLLHLEGTSEEAHPHRLWFEKGDEDLIVDIPERLSRLCGAFVLIPDTGGQGLVIYPGVDVDDALDLWDEES